MQLREGGPLGRQKWEHAITTLREKRNWPGQVRPTIEDDDEDEDDPIVGCQQLLVTPKIPLLPILKLLKQFSRLASLAL